MKEFVERCHECGHTEDSDGYGGNDCPDCGARMTVIEVLGGCGGLAVGLSAEDKRNLVYDLRRLTNPAVLKTDGEHAADRAKAKAVCRLLGVRDVDEAFEAFGKYGQNI